MAQALVRNLNDGTLADYRAAARAKGSSLEADLRELIERNRPRPERSREELIELARRIRAMSPVREVPSDSTAYIRWDRDTGHGNRPHADWPDGAP